MTEKVTTITGRSAYPLASTKKTGELRQSALTNNAGRTRFAQALMLPDENLETFEDLRKSYFDFWQPQHVFEANLVDDMVAARWRLNRILAAETKVAARCVASAGETASETDQPNPNSRENILIRVFAFSEERHHRQIRSAIASLRIMQNQRRDREFEMARAVVK